MPSWALRTATLRPPTCERRPSEIARPAASSAARLIRKPLDSFSSDLDIWPCVTDRLRYEFKASMFWLMRRLMVIPSWNVESAGARPWARVRRSDRPGGADLSKLVEKLLRQGQAIAVEPGRAVLRAGRRVRGVTATAAK